MEVPAILVDPGSAAELSGHPPPTDHAMASIPWRPVRVRRLLLIGLGALLLPAGPASAHGGNGGSSSDYRAEITGYTPDAGADRGFELEIVQLGSRLELRRTTAREVVVLGYQGEPYLRLDATGVWENENSPATYLNRDRYASLSPPPSAQADAAPTWKRLHGGGSVRWHDHRAHWMSTIPPPQVEADPATPRVIFDDNEIDLLVDGMRTSAVVKLSWVPRPHAWAWLGLVAVGACAVLVLLAFRPRLGPWIALAAALAALLGRGPGTGWLLAGMAAVAAAIAGLVLSARTTDSTTGRWCSVVAGAIAVAIGFERLDVFHHALTSGWWPGTPQRGLVAVALGGGVAVVAAVFVSPTARRTAPDPTPSLHPSG
jgi:hypothetical protein